ncbi:hypothetical protein [Paenibacillus roseipurpureus]|uniref:Uncharacterized protein n=1 Tax=Paenibacillus roseopurpureus TaxID=2918901 RepID=A0AA96RKL3_9BACL|nr:hypothetical protein [Paenibacillus sp. MBLB1832]WNR44436.1 hypothetical protein MJB10_25795 [Paenibacillus sp. MBLB1832]
MTLKKHMACAIISVFWGMFLIPTVWLILFVVISGTGWDNDIPTNFERLVATVFSICYLTSYVILNVKILRKKIEWWGVYITLLILASVMYPYFEFIQRIVDPFIRFVD